MAAPNTNPIYSYVGDIQWITNVITGNNTADLTSGTISLVFTADATNGGFVRELRMKANPGTSTVATVLRVWLNNGATTATASNSTLIDELGIPATTSSAVNPLPTFILPLGFALPPGYRIYITVGTTPTGSFNVTAIGGKY